MRVRWLVQSPAAGSASAAADRPASPVPAVIDRVPGLAQQAAGLRQRMSDERLRRRAYTRRVGDDAPDVRDWVWPGSQPPAEAATDAQRGQPA